MQYCASTPLGEQLSSGAYLWERSDLIHKGM